jgi:hypothetical protein
MKLSLLWAVLLVPLLGTAYADTNSNPDYLVSVGNSLDGFIDMIINTMNPIFDMAFNLQDNERLQQWGYEITQKQVAITEKQITNQLGHDPRTTCC